jgi:hypothetical protein
MAFLKLGDHHMRRRSFLKLVGLASVWATSLGARGALAAVPAASPSRETAHLGWTGLRYRADGGRIYVSADDGASWDHHTYLGPDYAVQRMVDDASGVRLSVGYGGRTFNLRLGSDQRSWRTV